MTAADRLIAEVAPRIRAEGKAEGRAEGRAEGKAEGRAEAAAALLRRLLTVKFGPLDAASEARIRAASIEELERWSERILVAETPSDVWGD